MCSRRPDSLSFHLRRWQMGGGYHRSSWFTSQLTAVWAWGACGRVSLHERVRWRTRAAGCCHACSVSRALVCHSEVVWFHSVCLWGKCWGEYRHGNPWQLAVLHGFVQQKDWILVNCSVSKIRRPCESQWHSVQIHKFLWMKKQQIIIADFYPVLWQMRSKLVCSVLRRFLKAIMILQYLICSWVV